MLGMCSEVELIYDAQAELGEGPVWHDNALWWVDILGGELHRLDIDSRSHQVRKIGDMLGVAVPCVDSRWIVAERQQLAFYDWDSGDMQAIASVEEDRKRNRFNDGKCDPKGRFWVGTMSIDGQPGAGSLYSLAQGQGITQKVPHVTISNGLGWSPDGSRLFYVDTSTQRIDVFQFDMASGNISDRRPLVEIPASRGAPDGIAVDSDGHIWVALWGGGAVECYDGISGRNLDRIELEVSLVTSCCFGGPSMDRMFITSARTGLSETELRAEPVAGGVFGCRPGVCGTSTTPFKSDI